MSSDHQIMQRPITQFSNVALAGPIHILCLEYPTKFD